MDTDRLINTLRDVIARRRLDLPLPSDVDIDDLLEAAAEEIELLDNGDRNNDEDEHCDGCTCDDDEDDDKEPVLAAAAHLRERLFAAWRPAT